MNTPNYHSYLLSLFSEMNGHIRNTENKYLTISLSYISLVAIVSSVILREMILTAETNINYSVVYGLIILIGWCVILLQRWYMVWKQHYLIKCQTIDREISRIFEDGVSCSLSSEKQGNLKPCWLNQKQESKNKKLLSLFSADNTINILTNTINAGVVFKLSYDLFLSGEYKLLTDIIFIYSISVCIIYKTITEGNLTS